MFGGQAGVGFTDRLKQALGIGWVAEQVDGLLPAFEFFLGEDDDVALATLAGYLGATALSSAWRMNRR